MTQLVAKENIVIKKEKPSFTQWLKTFINSNWAMLTITLIIALFWTVNLPVISATFIVVFEILVFIFCPENPKAFLYPIIAIFFAPKTSLNTPTLIYAGVLIAIFIATVVTYVILKIKKENVVCRKGRMFWFFIPLIIGNFLGGAIGHFNILISVIVTLLLIVLYGAYWFCLNFVKNAQRYFAYCAIFLSLLITLEIFINYFFVGNFFSCIVNKVSYFGLININCASIIMLTGLCSCFYLAKGSKKDYLYILLAVLLDLIILQNYSRIAIFAAVLISIVYFIIVVHKSNNKKAILITFGVCCVIALIVAGIMWRQIYNLLLPYINLKFKLNGRASLWNWCVDQFKHNPIFGIGFTTTDPYVLAGNTPGMDIQGTFAYVHTHNFFLHHLTCIGIVGLLLSIPFYVQKYRILFKKLTTYKIFVVLMFLILYVTSLVDPTYTSDFFLIFYCMAVFAIAENITDGYEKDEIDEELALVSSNSVGAEVATKDLKENNNINASIDNKAITNKNNKTKFNKTLNTVEINEPKDNTNKSVAKNEKLNIDVTKNKENKSSIKTKGGNAKGTEDKTKQSIKSQNNNTSAKLSIDKSKSTSQNKN